MDGAMRNTLTIKAIDRLKPKEKTYRKPDGDNLYLRISPAGGKYWEMRYRRPLDGKEDTLVFGKYPIISLKKARELRAEAQERIALGIDPKAEKKRLKIETDTARQREEATVRIVSQQWFDTQTVKNANKTRQGTRGRLDNHVLPFIGDMPIYTVTFADLVSVVRRMEADNLTDLPRRVAQIIEQVFRFAHLNKFIDGNIAADLTKVLAQLPPDTKCPRPAFITPEPFADLLKRIAAYEYRGKPATFTALYCAPYLVLRSEELCSLEWEDIDLNTATAHLPKGRMKDKNRPHDVPLPRQVVASLERLRRIHSGKFVFESTGKKKHITGEALQTAFRAMGISTKHDATMHGFRSSFSTMGRELLGFSSELIEKQLHHASADKVAAAYDRSTQLEQRRRMMQEWADYLDSLRAGA